MGDQLAQVYGGIRDMVTKPLVSEVSLFSLFVVAGIGLLVILPAWGWILFHMRRAGEEIL